MGVEVVKYGYDGDASPLIDMYLLFIVNAKRPTRRDLKRRRKTKEKRKLDGLKRVTYFTCHF